MTPLLIAAAPLSLRATQLRDAADARHASQPGPPAAITLWAEPWTRTVPLPPEGAGIHVMDLHGAIAACPGACATTQSAWCEKVADTCQGASLALVGSPAEYGFWSAIFGRRGIACRIAIVPYAPMPVASAPPGAKSLAIAGPWIADPALRPLLESSLAWAASSGIPLAAGPAPQAPGALAIAVLAPSTLPPAMLLDLRRDTPAERVATPPWITDALASGIPVLSSVDGVLSRTIEAAGAGRILSGAFLPPPNGPSGFPPPDRAAAAAALQTALGLATAHDSAVRATWSSAVPPTPLGPQGRVLVISNEAQTLAAVRVHLPFSAMARRGVIEGYAVLHHGALAFDTHPGTPRGFDAIWVHRSADPAIRLLLELLGRPFIYDIDDNLLASPRYRPAFHPVSVATTKDLLQRAAVVCTATARLGRRLSARLGASTAANLAASLVVAPNLADAPAVQRQHGPPRALIWASSDRPALAGSAAAIVRAVRDHCLAHGTPLLCLGAEPDEALRVPGLELEHLPVLPHAEYRARLRAFSPAILVCPLETGADPDTQDFIDGKSDIKLIEALSEGLVGVFSRAAPYLDSDLPPPIIVDNTYESWLEGLEAARSACLAPTPPPPWPNARDAAGFGLAPWAAALGRARLAAPLSLSDVLQATAEARHIQERLIPPEEFDEDDYLANYDDVRAAVQAGHLPSGYAHYVGPGRVEGRYARKRSTPEALGEPWWAALLLDIGRLEAATASRAAALAGFERRLALRRALAARSAR